MYKNKPNENYDDPHDAAAIKLAEKNIGDFKLKTASDYVVPEEERVNAEKKRAQLLSLKRWVSDFNVNVNEKIIFLYLTRTCQW